MSDDEVGPRVAAHYRNLLAEHYTWMLGDDLEATARGQAELLDGLVPGEHRGPAVDLGSGSGAQSLALADLGHDPVLAVDPDPTLLDELRTHLAGRPAVRPRRDDAAGALRALDPGEAAVVVCMGDTLTHLPSRAAVTEVIAGAARVLRPGGALVLTYRDLTAELRGTDRFIPVRSDDDRIFVCFLDAVDDDVVEVHDIVHTRSGGEWTMIASSYPKLRLAPGEVADRVRAAGLELTAHEAGPGGMWRTVGRVPVADSDPREGS